MELPRIVLKFGGTSVGDPEAIRSAGRIVEKSMQERPLVIVSAAARITDTLLALVTKAAQGEGGAEFTEIARRHEKLLSGLGLASNLLDGEIRELHDLLHGIQLLRDATPRTMDLVLSYGERLMAPLFAAHLRTLGLPARAWIAGDLGLITDDRFTRARPLRASDDLIAARLGKSEEHVPVVTGYLARTESGLTTTLGRGGSDYSASLFARAIGAREVQIWTDVDGILTADPRVVPEAKLIERLSFREAGELAYSGAKVLHPSTITPAMERGIPVRVLNTLRSGSPGTTILGDPGESGARALCAIAHKHDVQVITVESPRMLARHGFLSRIAEVFDRHQVSVDMISTSEVSVSLTTDDKVPDLAAPLADLSGFADVRLEEGLGLVSVVGSGLGRDTALVGDILHATSAAGVEIVMISYGTTRTNLSFLVRGEKVKDVVRLLHRRYFES